MLAEAVTDIRARIIGAAVRAGRNGDSVRLMAVAKTVPPERMLEAANAGVVLFGENYVQEAAKKLPGLRERVPEPVEFHFIGHLQRNKAKEAVRLFDVIQCVDRIELGAALDRAAGTSGRRMPVLMQVNTSGESSKSGVAPEAAAALAEALLAFPTLELRGLMCIGRFVDESATDAQRRAEFRLLASLRSELEGRFAVSLPELSMGMSHDFELAVEEGATIVRVGTAIFGERSHV